MTATNENYLGNHFIHRSN